MNGRPCKREHPDPTLTQATCRLCFLSVNDEWYRETWAAEERRAARKSPAGGAQTRRTIIQSRIARVPCVHRGAATGETRQCVECGHHDKQIPVYKCDLKGLCSIDRQVKEATYCLKCDDYVPAAESPGGKEEGVRRPMRWAYGVTTVPERRETYLPRTLASLRAAGFESPRLFVDGIGLAEAERTYGGFGLEVTVRGRERIRTFGNWVLALWELYVRHVEADRFALFQDDCVAVRNLRQYLERVEYPERGYLNLFTMPANYAGAAVSVEPTAFGGRRVGFYPSPKQNGLGAVALVFSRDAVPVLLGAQHMVMRPQHAERGWKTIDGGIVTAFRKAGWLEYVHAPSLVQHIGAVTSMGNRPQPSADSFPGEEFDATELLPRRVEKKAAVE